ncbi:Leucine-rich repeat, cysteine-containing subtype [Corchorus olitorius]|uniref:Leucine-rich repeat, cysteine-containing subtype n=1 Tax=Corchorus olitorius TaxID=93759 RepID=A0A1R3KZ13_9ROSI|nr:Leucine-rich repeat, cysteine-containing subtype [Corchorus olitorius]
MSDSELSDASHGDEKLPPECWQLIFKHIKEEDLKTVSLVCKNFLAYSNLIKESLDVIHPNVKMLSQHLKRFTQLKTLFLTHFQGDFNEALCEIARSGITLEAFHSLHRIFGPSTIMIKIESLRELGSNPNRNKLKVLSCDWMSNLPDNDLVVIANSFANLEELTLKGKFAEGNSPLKFPSYTDKGIESLASKLKLLKRIHLYGRDMNGVSDESVVALSMNCAFLGDFTIIIEGNHGVTEHGIGLLLRNRPNLETLCIGYIKNYSSQITIANSIRHAKALTYLWLCAMQVSDELLMTIAEAIKLPLELTIVHCKGYTVLGLLSVLSNCLTQFDTALSNFLDEDIKFLFNKDAGQLTQINISECQVTSSTFFQLLTKCCSLQHIRMESATLDVVGENNIPLPKYHKIKIFRLESGNISDELVKQFGFMFPNLEVLELSLCQGVTIQGIEAILKSCKVIRKLILESYQKTVIIKSNSDLPKVGLKVLKLATSCIDNEGLDAISKKCPQLLSVDLDHCKKVTTEGIKQMVEDNKTLRKLKVRNCDLVDYGDLLEWKLSRANLASLKKLCLGKGKFSKEQRDQFLHHGCLLVE